VKKILALPADIWACGKFRIIEPYSNMPENDEIEYKLFDHTKNDGIPITIFVQMLMNYDAIVFQRVADKNLLLAMKTLKQYGKKIYMDIDDDLFNVSTMSPAYKVWRRGTEQMMVFTEAVRLVDGLFVSTPELVEAYRHLNKNITVFGNALTTNDPKFDVANSQRNLMPPNRVVVMWSGSSTHMDSILEISHGIKQVFDNNPEALLAVGGNQEFYNLFPLKPDIQKVWIPPVSINEYYKMPSQADIGIAPVKLNKFNDGKSELKCLEYGIWGVPTVCSNAAPYRRFEEVSGGGNLVTKANTPKHWVKALNKLIKDEPLRKFMGHTARQTIFREYDLSKINAKRHEFFVNNLVK
jgi:glycosyltransferase involved in cell wall biosynthesis